MKRVDDSSKNFMATTEGISASTEEQVAGLANIVKTMKDMQAGTNTLPVYRLFYRLSAHFLRCCHSYLFFLS